MRYEYRITCPGPLMEVVYNVRDAIQMDMCVKDLLSQGASMDDIKIQVVPK